MSLSMMHFIVNVRINTVIWSESEQSSQRSIRGLPKYTLIMMLYMINSVNNGFASNVLRL